MIRRGGERKTARSAVLATVFIGAAVGEGAQSEGNGGLGDGHRLKLANNLISLGCAALYSEAPTLAVRAGPSVASFDDLVRSSRMRRAFYDAFVVADGFGPAMPPELPGAVAQANGMDLKPMSEGASA
jgi:hypothetical protein